MLIGTLWLSLVVVICSIDYQRKALQRVRIHSAEYDWNSRSFVLSQELNYITIRKIIVF